MVNKCLECNKIISATKMYCEACEREIKDRVERREKNKVNYKNLDFFERQRLK